MGGVTPYYESGPVVLYLGDCVEVMKSLPENSVDACICDPPYGLEFMGKEWDSFKATGSSSRFHSPKDEGREFTNESGHMWDNTKALPRLTAGHPFQQWCETWAREAYRVLKPGGHIAAFGGTRTHHRLVCGIEDAGFEIRDEADWMYGSGFPKSKDVSKAIDKAAGAVREVIGDKLDRPGYHLHGHEGGEALGHGLSSSTPETRSKAAEITAPATDAARQWEGWGTALKPAHEPICLARKPLAGTVAANVLAHGTGALNIDGCRIGTYGGTTRGENGSNAGKARNTLHGGDFGIENIDGGRWPANVILDDEAAALLDLANPGELPSRYYYTAKASRSEREAGLDDLPPALRTDGREPGGVGGDNPRLRVSERRNDHPTVKPVSVMRWLVRLITPPSGLVLDPFLGSGTTGMAALDEGMRFIGIDMTERYVEIARYRVTHRHVIDHEVRPANEAIPQGRLL